MTQYPPHYRPHESYPVRQAPRNGLGTASLVLGIVGIVFAWIPIVGFIGFITGILGTIFGGVGISRANKGTATNKGVAMTGLIVSLGALVTSTIVFFSFASYVAEGANASAPPLPAPRAAGGSAATAQIDEPISSDQTEFRVGQTANLDGYEIFVDKVQAARSTIGGQALVCSMVTLTNKSDENQDFNVVFDWKIQDPAGVQQIPTTFAADVLGSGELAPGGTTSGKVCVETSRTTGNFKVIYDPAFSFVDTITWAGTR